MLRFRLSSKSIGIAATVVLHLVLIGTLLHYDHVHATAPAVPVTVTLVDSAGEKQIQAPPQQKPKEKIKQVKRVDPTPTPQPELSASAAPTPAETPVQDALAASITLPRFDAKYLNNPPPLYPPIARRLGETGRVLLRVFVRTDGSAADVQINKSSGSSRLDQAALDAVRKWSFEPARRGGIAVEAPVLVPISFTLEG